MRSRILFFALAHLLVLSGLACNGTEDDDPAADSGADTASMDTGTAPMDTAMDTAIDTANGADTGQNEDTGPSCDAYAIICCDEETGADAGTAPSACTWNGVQCSDGFVDCRTLDAGQDGG